MGARTWRWQFREGGVPSAETVVEALRRRSGLVVDCTEDDDGTPVRMDFPEIKELLIFLDPEDDGLSLLGPIATHPYLWVQMNKVMAGLGGEASGSGWQSKVASPVLERHWSELTRWQRFLLRLPTIGASRPLDFLLEREG